MPSHYTKPRRSSHHDDFPPSLPPAREDPELDAAIGAELQKLLSQLDFDPASVQYAVLDAVVTLTGHVPDRKSKYRLESLAAQIKGVADVENLLKLTSGTPPHQADGRA